jgi:hypothetical protein
MPPSEATLDLRVALLRASGVPVSPGDVERVEASVAASLKALDIVAEKSLFDTEPQAFEVMLRRLAEPERS